MRRRELITLLGGAAAAWPLAARAQQGERTRRVGMLIPRAANDPESLTRIVAFQQGLRQLGWIEGRNLRIETQWAGGSAEAIRKHSAELAALAPDVILAHGSATVGSFKEGKLRALAVTSKMRSQALPEVPTMAVVPARTPKEIVALLHREIAKAIALPGMKERMATLGFEPVGNTPEECAAQFRTETAKWGKVIREAGIKPQ